MTSYQLARDLSFKMPKSSQWTFGIENNLQSVCVCTLFYHENNQNIPLNTLSLN